MTYAPTRSRTRHNHDATGSLTRHWGRDAAANPDDRTREAKRNRSPITPRRRASRVAAFPRHSAPLSPTLKHGRRRWGGVSESVFLRGAFRPAPRRCRRLASALLTRLPASQEHYSALIFANTRKERRSPTRISVDQGRLVFPTPDLSAGFISSPAFWCCLADISLNILSKRFCNWVEPVGVRQRHFP
jgi:hypothetical protein